MASTRRNRPGPLRAALAAALALLFALPGALRAEEETGVTCDLHALRFETDARLLKMYDGLRRGLEKARLGRVCLAPAKNEAASLDAFAETLRTEQAEAGEGKRAQPIAFAFGDVAANALKARATDVPRVLVVTRYTAGGTPLVPLPKPTGPSSVIYADLQLERLGEVVTQLAGASWPRIELAWRSTPEDAEAKLARAAEVAGLKGLGPASPEDADVPLAAVLHVRFGVGEEVLSFTQAARLAKKRGVPLITDDPIRFRQGVATVVVAADHHLVGRYASEAARVLTRYPKEVLPARGVRTLRVLVDLDAADKQGHVLPLPFLARASELHRGIRPAPSETPR
ncbi:MAG: hypothetical protein QNJ98_08205 [Planctomycetota bacterium]|nr:hypothetical protein [Planctomycetota bacterium]